MSEALDVNGPLRIEVSSSQIDGGQAIGWVDPARVLGSVAFSEPQSVFDRFVLPHLDNPESAEDNIEQLPGVVSALINGLKSIHLRLYRENHTLMKDPKWVRLTAAYADESRIYFIKSQTAWIYLLRNNRAFLIGEAQQAQIKDLSKSAALGGKDKLQIQVTSLEVQENDLILLVTGESALPPDLHAVTNLFSNSVDLKRACDGLVNLLGLQGGSAAVVAFRYTPLLQGVSNKKMDLVAGEEFLGEITEWARILSPEDNTPLNENPPADKADEDIASAELPDIPWNHKPDETSDDTLDETAANSPFESENDTGEKPEEPADYPDNITQADSVPAFPVTDTERQKRQSRFSSLKSARSTIIWVVIAIALLALASIMLSGVGWPGFLEDVKTILSSNNSGAMNDFYLLDVTSEPPGAIVAIDGEKIPGRTPITRLHVPQGKHLISLHLGVAGVWSDSLDYKAGEHQSVHADFIGSLAIQAKDLTNNPKAWLAGQTDKVDLPAVFAELPSGWYRVFFEDDNIPLWERKILVRNGTTSSVEINNVFSTDKVLLYIEGLKISDLGRLRPSLGDSVFLNRKFVGLTPIESEISPGLYGVRVTHAGESYQEILRLSAGTSRFVTPQFGLRHFPSFTHVEPGRVVLQGPVFLAMEIHSKQTGLRHPMLHLPDTPNGPQAISMTEIDSGQNLYVGRIEPTTVRLDTEVPYYFSITTPAGEEAVSELYRFEPVNNSSSLVDAVGD